ncbi:MAG: hypothetical protein RSE34_00690 [Brevundimonas sp.]
MRGDGFQSRQVFRIEAFAGDRKLDAYVIPTTKPTRRKSAPLSRYDRLEPSPVPGHAYSMDGVEIFVGVDLGAEEDLTAIWTRNAGRTADEWKRAAQRSGWNVDDKRRAVSDDHWTFDELRETQRAVDDHCDARDQILAAVVKAFGIPRELLK